MLSSVNPYGLGNIYTQNIQPNTKDLQPPTPQKIQDSQELPNLSKEALEIRKFSDGIKGANEIVGAISTLIEKASLPLSNNAQNYDFENFDTNSFKNLFQ